MKLLGWFLLINSLLCVAADGILSVCLSHVLVGSFIDTK